MKRIYKRKYEGPYRAKQIRGHYDTEGNEIEMWHIVHLVSLDPEKYEELLPPRVYIGKFARSSANRSCKSLNIQSQKESNLLVA